MKTAQRPDINQEVSRRLRGTSTRAEINKIVETYEQVIAEFISEAYKVQLNGFLTIEPSVQAARKGRNMYTGETTDIPEKSKLKFRVGRDLQEAIGEVTPDEVRVAETVHFSQKALLEDRKTVVPQMNETFNENREEFEAERKPYKK